MAADSGCFAPQLRTEGHPGRFAPADSGFVNHSTFNKVGSRPTFAGGTLVNRVKWKRGVYAR